MDLNSPHQMLTPNTCSYDDAESGKLKAEFAKSQGLAGVAFYDSSQSIALKVCPVIQMLTFLSTFSGVQRERVEAGEDGVGWGGAGGECGVERGGGDFDPGVFRWPKHLRYFNRPHYHHREHDKVGVDDRRDRSDHVPHLEGGDSGWRRHLVVGHPDKVLGDNALSFVCVEHGYLYPQRHR